MAYRANRKMTIGYGKQTPWCKFCHDMGFEGYDTHYTKDKRGPGGKVVCPKLLSMECKSCGEKGHMHTHCTKLYNRNNCQSNSQSKYCTPCEPRSSLDMIPTPVRNNSINNSINNSSIGKWAKKLDFSNDAEVKKLREQVAKLESENSRLTTANDELTKALKNANQNVQNAFFQGIQTAQFAQFAQCAQYEYYEELSESMEPAITVEICEALDRFEEEEAESQAYAEMTYERNVEDDFYCDINNADYEGEQKEQELKEQKKRDIDTANKIWEQNMKQPSKKSSCAVSKKVNFEDLVKEQSEAPETPETTTTMSWLTVAKSRKRAPPLPKKYIPTSTKKRINSTNRYKALSEREMRNQTADDSLWGDMAEEKDEF